MKSSKIKESKGGNVRKIKAFTLIELLVVVVIIGILATFVILALSGYSTRTRETKRKNDVRQVYTALTSWANDGHVIPTVTTLLTPTVSATLTGPDGKTYLPQAPLDNGNNYIYYKGDGTIANGFVVWAGSLYNTATPMCWFMGTGKSNIQKALGTLSAASGALSDGCVITSGPTATGGVM